MFTRRTALHAIPVATLAGQLSPEGRSRWSPDWDRALIDAALAQQDESFDAKEAMLTRRVGPEYNYHSLIRNQVAHPTVPSLHYALLLLEAGGKARLARAQQVIDRVLSLQDTDPSSKWYGIWGYYLEEPPPKMSPADWNWADFNGATLLLIAYRHGAKLRPALAARLREGIHYAAQSVKRRNVSMGYTNIAIQGTFVTLAAAQLLEDTELRSYAKDRLRRFAATVDQTGSFNEYNSPTYANVSIVNLTRIRMTVRDPDDLALTEKIHHRAWLHLGKHWHAPTKQLAGPMSRCYSTDIGAPLWLQKGLEGRLSFVTREQARSLGGSLEVAVHDYRCPESVAPLFLESGPARQHRELFLNAPAPIAPVQGVTWLHPEFCLGSVNRGDFWIQRRPLLAFWGGPERPARFVQLRFLKDDYDFSSALFYGVQEKNCILGCVNFRSPGGDKHISLDMIQNGEFRASRLRLCLDIAGVTASSARIEGPRRVAVDLGGAKLWFAVREAVFGSEEPKFSLGWESGRLVVSLDLLGAASERLIRWQEVSPAFLAFTLAMEGRAGSLEEFHRVCSGTRFQAGPGAGEFAWESPAGKLTLSAGVGVASVAEQDKAFRGGIDGSTPPLVRLSDERLV